MSTVKITRNGSDVAVLFPCSTVVNQNTSSKGGGPIQFWKGTDAEYRDLVRYNNDSTHVLYHKLTELNNNNTVFFIEEEDRS